MATGEGIIARTKYVLKNRAIVFHGTLPGPSKEICAFAQGQETRNFGVQPARGTTPTGAG